MEITHSALGIRFDTRKFPQGDAQRHSFELLYSVLSYTELRDMKVHGGFPYEAEPWIYLVVLESTSFKPLRKNFVLLNSDPSVKMFLADDMPFVDKNRLLGIREIDTYGNYDYIKYKLSNAPICVYDIVPSKTRTHMQGRNFHFLFAPDSFKGTISSDDAIRMLTLAAHENHYRGCNVTSLPMADGGEGTLYALQGIIGGNTVTVDVHDPLGNSVAAKYLTVNNDTAIIEMAQASGLTLIPEDKQDVRHASSYGTGELIMHAINNGFRKITVTLGGSATNDGGMGCAKAMGVRFLDKNGEEVPCCGDGLIFVRDIDMSFVSNEVRETVFTLMTDVQNPLTGITGATMTFSEQKGADAKTMFELECGMKNFRRYLNNAAGFDICKSPGAGAAGGMGAMLMSLFNAKQRSGIETLLDLAEFDKKLKNVSLVVTGEGRLDKQTISGGKAVAGIIKRVHGKVPVAILCGSAKEETIRELDNTGVVTLAHSFIDEQKALDNASDLFYDAAANMFTLLNSGQCMRRSWKK